MRFDIGLFGDTPYGAKEEAAFLRLMDHMNQSNMAFSVHTGDIKGGGERCSDEAYLRIRRVFDAARHPLIYVPGDNEWTDCHRPACGGYEPMERLQFLRSVFYADDMTLGQPKLRLDRQSKQPRYAAYREHVRWEYGGVLFVGLNLPGSNNNLGRTREMDLEYHDRQAAYLAWMEESFEWAKKAGSKGVMLFIQANPYFDKKWAERIGFNHFLDDLKRLTVAFAKPVVLVHGDTHYFRVDKPMTDEETGRIIANFTRVETFGSPNAHWVRAIVDPKDPNLFRFEPVIVPENAGLEP